MSIIVADSLSRTLDVVCEAMFMGRSLGRPERVQVATWIAGRNGLPDAYAQTFALFEAERREGIRLFTGERVTSSAGHIAAREACRVLRWLDVPAAANALKQVSQRLAQRVGPLEPPSPAPEAKRANWLWPYRGGVYCCGKCTVGLWRDMPSGNYDFLEQRLTRGLAWLRDCRKGDGTWRVFPFWYTNLALVDIDHAAAVAELKYAAPRCQRALAFKGRQDVWSARRAELARRILARI
jgi:hypothetical protein